MLGVSLGAPYLVVGPFAGVVVDRVQINRVLIISNIGRAVMTVALFFYETLIAPLTHALELSQTVLGLALAAVGAGGVLGALALGTANATKKPFLLVTVGSGAGAVLVTALGEAINTVALLMAPFIGAAIASVLSFGAAFVAGGIVMLFVARRAYQLRRLY